MPLYDLMLLLDPNATDERREEIVSNTRSTIEADGQLVGLHNWGMRRMAYEIDHRGEADYRLFQLEAAPELIDRLSHTLKITDGVLRFRVIRLKPGAPPPPEPRAQPARLESREEEGTAQVAARSAADAPARSR
ncbi:MAG TPA: 30S ribosomal protein S6 [Thermoleophilaceae bacterium]